jgi:hypothetical protein
MASIAKKVKIKYLENYFFSYPQALANPPLQMFSSVKVPSVKIALFQFAQVNQMVN